MTTPSPIDPIAFEDDLERILVVLHNAKIGGIQRMSALDISENLKLEHGLHLHWRTIKTALFAMPNLVERRKQKGKWLFGLLRAGRERISAPASAVHFVDPTKAVQAVLTLHDLLGQCSGVVRVCDPYFDNVTLQHLDACAAATEIRVLTKNVKSSASLLALHAAFQTQGKNLQVRIVSANVLHDRYIIDSNRMKILGSSLNGFGKKQCFVIEAGSDMRQAMLHVFDGHWGSATTWP
jgi:hypothetical protein